MEIDFNQISPEYYLNISKELQTKYRIEFQITEQWIAELDPLNTHKGLKVGDIGTRFPEWPNDPPEALKLLKDYFARDWYMVEVAGFLEKFYSWNEKAMIEKLDQIKQFISEAKKINLEYAYRDRYFSNDEKQKVVYLRIANNYYEYNNIQYDYLDAKIVYGRYFLFKELLEKKLKRIEYTKEDVHKLWETLRTSKIIHSKVTKGEVNIQKFTDWENTIKDKFRDKTPTEEYLFIVNFYKELEASIPEFILNNDIDFNAFNLQNETAKYETIKALMKLNGYDSLPKYDKYFEYFKSAKNLHDLNPNKINILPQLSPNLTDPQKSKLFDLLIDGKFIPDTTDKENFLWAFGCDKHPENWQPIKWIKLNSRTKGKSLNKLSLLNLLSILKVPVSQITNRHLLNSLFAKPDGNSIKFTSSNYPQKEYNSEYNPELTEIISKLQ